MQEKRKAKSQALGSKERRSDLKIIRTKVSRAEIYVWAMCLCVMTIVLTSFVFAGIFIK